MNLEAAGLSSTAGCRIFFVSRVALHRAVAAFVGADAAGVVDGGYEHLAVANLPGPGGLGDGVNGGFHLRIGQHGFDFYFGEKIHRIFAAAINFRVPFLPAKTLDLGDGHSLDAQFVERLLDFIQLERFDDRFDFFHKSAIIRCRRVRHVGKGPARGFHPPDPRAIRRWRPPALK